MGRGKRNRNNLETLPPSKTATDQGATVPPPDDNNPNNQEHSNEINQFTKIEIDQFTKIESDCQAAIAAHLGGNPVEALSLINEALVAHENTSLVHATLCRLHHLEADRVGPSAGAEFQGHLRAAVGLARRAVSLSPDSDEFGTLYGEAMYKLASEIEGFDEVVGGCEQALSKENALQHSTDASLVFKALKEETESQSLNGKQDCSNAKTSKSLLYWNAMSDDRKIGLIEVRIRDLKEYCRKKNGLVERVFSEGVAYAAKNKNWKFFECYFCDDKFQYFELRVEHIEREHEAETRQYEKLKPFLFTEVDADGGGSHEVYHIFLLNGDVFMTDIERAVFTGDLSCPLDDRLLRVEVEFGSASTEGSALPPDIDGFTKWLFDYSLNSTVEELGTQWTHLRDLMKREGMRVRVRFEEEFSLFENLRAKQSELLLHCRSLRLIQIVCGQELWHRKEENHVHRKFEPLLKKLVDYDSPSRISRLKAVVDVINEARTIRQLNDPSSTDFEDQEDVSIRMAVENQTEQALSELCKNEALLTRRNGVLWRLLVIYKHASLDYRVITVALMRNFIHAKLEALAYEDAQQKSDAAYAELMSELSLDTKESTSKGKSGPKLSKKTSKANKKNKHYREVKDSKASSSKQPIVEQEDSSKQPNVEQEEKAEQVYFPDAEEMMLPVDEARQVVEALEKKLEEQRQFEDEAKQKARMKLHL